MASGAGPAPGLGGAPPGLGPGPALPRHHTVRKESFEQAMEIQRKPATWWGSAPPHGLPKNQEKPKELMKFLGHGFSIFEEAAQS